MTGQAVKASRVMRARKASRCPLCRQPVTAGQQIGKTSAAWCHTECIIDRAPTEQPNGHPAPGRAAITHKEYRMTDISTARTDLPGATLGDPEDITDALSECQAARELAEKIRNQDEAGANATRVIEQLNKAISECLTARGFAETIRNLLASGQQRAAANIAGVVQHIDKAIVALAMLNADDDDHADLDNDAAADGPWDDGWHGDDDPQAS